MLPSITVADVFKGLLLMSYFIILTIPAARQIWDYLHLESKTLSQAARVTGVPCHGSGDCSGIQGNECRSLFLGCGLSGLAYHFSFFLCGLTWVLLNLPETPFPYLYGRNNNSPHNTNYCEEDA